MDDRQRAEVEDTINVARGFLADRASPTYMDKGIAGDFASALVLIGDACVVGMPCARHGGAVHGKEAEELRAGVEQILRNTAEVQPDEAADVLAGMRKSLIFLLDRVDARDSLGFLEATDRKSRSPRSVSADDNDAQCRAARRAFFAACSPGDKIAWGNRRSGIIQKIEDDYVTILDDGWPAESPRIVYTPPFVVKLCVDDMVDPRVEKEKASCE